MTLEKTKLFLCGLLLGSDS